MIAWTPDAAFVVVSSMPAPSAATFYHVDPSGQGGALFNSLGNSSGDFDITIPSP
jgi:hypothetical protein